jgi:hypothetical protein
MAGDFFVIVDPYLSKQLKKDDDDDDINSYIFKIDH